MTCGKWRTEVGGGPDATERKHSATVGTFRMTVSERFRPDGSRKLPIWTVVGPRKPGRTGFCTVASGHAQTVSEGKRDACDATRGTISRRDLRYANCAPGDMKAMSRRRARG